MARQHMGIDVISVFRHMLLVGYLIPFAQWLLYDANVYLYGEFAMRFDKRKYAKSP